MIKRLARWILKDDLKVLEGIISNLRNDKETLIRNLSGTWKGCEELEFWKKYGKALPQRRKANCQHCLGVEKKDEE